MGISGVEMLIFMALGLAGIAYLIWLNFRALSLMRKGALEITEAAQELENNKLHDAGNNLNKGINILYTLANIGIALLIIVVLITIAAISQL